MLRNIKGHNLINITDSADRHPATLRSQLLDEAEWDHPLLQEKYTGLETARLWKPFFLSFLAKTKREQPLPSQVYC